MDILDNYVLSILFWWFGCRCYELYVSKDSLPYTRSGSYKVFFHFSVSGFEVNETYTFIIRAMTGQERLYSAGLKPAYRVLPNDDKKWYNIPGFIWWKTAVDGFQIRFDHKFSCEENQSVYFAFSYPFGYNECMHKIDIIQKIWNK